MTPQQIQQHILRAIQDNQNPLGMGVPDSVIAEKIGLPVQDVRDYLELLGDEDKVQVDISYEGHAAWLKAKGRLAFKQDPKMTGPGGLTPPVEIQESLARFRGDHPDQAKVAFVMMRFGQSNLHDKIVKGIKSTLEPMGITGQPCVGGKSCTTFDPSGASPLPHA